MKHKGGFDYCYNGQISVDSNSQIIVGQHLTQNENDKKEVEKALCEIEDNTGKVPDKMSLDNGYMSSGNISALAGAKVDAYIAAGKGEKDSLPDKIGKLNFSYDSGKDIFICPACVVLKLKSIGENRVYKAEEMVCGGCSFPKRCSAKRNDIATIYTDDKGIILATMKEKMKSVASKEIYRKRKIIVEPVFGQIKTGGFRGFSLREFEKAGGEFCLVCMVSNFKKIVSKIKSEINCIKEVELVQALS